jgi:hypothetical protein
MLRRIAFALVLCLLVGGFAVSASALAAAPEEPVTVSPATSITGTSATLEGVLNPNAAGEPGEYAFFYNAGSECTGGSTAPQPPGIALGLEGEAVSVAVSGLSPGTQYTFCAFARNAAEETAFGQPVSFTTPAVAPVVSETFATGVASDSATLGASIVPGGAATTYHFEYGPTAAYGQSTPESASIGADNTAHSVSAHIQGLQAGVVYHYRVVASSAAAPGGVDGPDRTFTAQPAVSAAFTLPDSRGYELVTPAAKGGGGLPTPTARFQASVSGDGMTYMTVTPLPDATTGEFDVQLARRGAGGWLSQDVIPPVAPRRVEAAAFSPDLSKAAMTSVSGSPPVVADEPQSGRSLFVRDNATETYQLANVTPAGVTPGAAAFEGASADFSHVLFVSEAQLVANAPSGHENLFEWAGGSVSLVSLIPVAPATRCGAGGPACVPAPEGAALGGGVGPAVEVNGLVNAVSPDGSNVFFIDAPSTSQFSRRQLFVRENGETTVQVSASRKTNGSGPGGTDPGGTRPAAYWPASPDGNVAFFTSCEQLTNDSTAHSLQSIEGCLGQGAGSLGVGRDLYAYDTASDVLSDLTVDHSGDPLGADVQAVLGTSSDGSYVYFVANGVLAAGASLGDCAVEGFTSSFGGQCNIYVSHDGTTTFIARIDNPAHDYAVGNESNDWRRYATTARVTPDGTRLAFESTASLTGYDNMIGSGASTCGTGEYTDELIRSGDPRCSEVYLYDAISSELRCVSCNPTGARPLGATYLKSVEAPEYRDSVQTREANGYEYLPRTLSADGSRLFFESEDALVPGDVNGRMDVYEYEGGRVYLISSGTSGDDSWLADASVSGNDVFFTTRSRLVGQDGDQRVDLYDARVGGGFPFAPPSAPCVGEACKAPAALGPVEPALASQAAGGAGNLTPPALTGSTGVTPKAKPARCGRGRVRKKGKCVKKRGKRAKRARGTARGGK